MKLGDLQESAWRPKHRMRRGYNGSEPIMYCRECKGTGQSLTRHCIGRQLTDAEEVAIIAGTLDFLSGHWKGEHPTNGIPK